MTLGERIQLKRKENGLSQEDLGSKMEVSRQTVYKWESNQATPELQKLIAMAEIFGVKIGWLINEEEDETKEAAYKEIADRLVGVIEANVKHSKSSRNKPLTAGLVGLLLFSIVFGTVKFNSLEHRYRELDRAIDRNNQYVQREISNISSNVATMLNNYNSITVNSDVMISGLDLMGNTITFTISAQPKTYTTGMKAMFHVSTGKEVYDFEGSEGNNKTFTVEAKVPLTNDYAEISVEFIHGETSETKQITSYDGLLANTFPLYDIIWQIDFAIRPDYKGFLDEYCEVMKMGYHESDDYYGFAHELPKIVSLEMFLTEDGVRVADYTYDEVYTSAQNTASGNGDVDTYWYYFKRPADIKLTQGKAYAEHFVATDEYGRQVEVISTANEVNTEFHLK